MEYMKDKIVSVDIDKGKKSCIVSMIELGKI